MEFYIGSPDICVRVHARCMYYLYAQLEQSHSSVYIGHLYVDRLLFVGFFVFVPSGVFLMDIDFGLNFIFQMIKKNCFQCSSNVVHLLCALFFLGLCATGWKF